VLFRSAEGDLPVDRDRRGAGIAQSFGRHVGAHGGFDLEVCRGAGHGDARAFARGVCQHLPGLIRPAELEDAEAHQPVTHYGALSGPVRVGMLGITPLDAPQATDPRNLVSLQVLPLRDVVEREATRLRAAGATVIVVLAHAGGSCDRFTDPDDLSSCQTAKVGGYIIVGHVPAHDIKRLLTEKPAIAGLSAPVSCFG